MRHFNAENKLKRLSRLTRIQFDVTQNNATEKPYDNAFWNFSEKGIYVDIVSGEPLFASLHKYNTLSGWPMFFKVLSNKHVKEVSDVGRSMIRMELRSRDANSHLGHVFTDGPGPSGIRYCLNSAALRFVPFCELEVQGYGEFRPLFNGITSSA